ncbi:MAG: NADH-quinone oxidoreductase subunit, partial [Cryptosporangiaceae bacterium]|nr:NADH-quinone oxidoreductase subunit [Cryptosporangiaceae bacterium]
AATMVVAGVFLIARTYGVFWEAFSIHAGGINFVSLIGGTTVIIAALLAFVQSDIKKVLAYSTVSQLGYMVMALGVGAWTAGIFHLFTHAFFKALLFLGAGSVSHAVHSFDMKKDMGGMRKQMPVTFWTFVIGSLALAGVFPLAGFWSKDEILLGAHENGFPLMLIVGLAGAFMTAAYMTRACYLIFAGEYRGHGHPHESPPSMTVAMIVLAVGSVAAGGLLAFHNALANWLNPVFGGATEQTPAEVAHKIPALAVTALVLVFVLAGVALAVVIFREGTAPQEQPARSVLVRAARANLYADAFNEAVFMRPGQWLARALVYVDNRGIDGLVNGLAAAVGGGSARLRRLQTGFVRSYALTMLGGAFLVVAALLVVRLG